MSETTPLLRPTRSRWSPDRLFPSLNRVFFTSLLISMTFAFTQSTLIYSFRVMTCDAYYGTHGGTGREHQQPGSDGKDRCAIPQIDSRTASAVALMSTVTVACTIVNLFVSAWFIERFGIKAAMFQQTFWAALRCLTQIYAQTVGGQMGINIIQTTQFFNMLGSGGGFQLCANEFVNYLSDEEERTANFGRISGIFMLGSGLGFSIGGLAEKYFGMLAPFQCAFWLLVFCTFFGMFFLPYVEPQATKDKKKAGGAPKRKGFLAPIKVFAPRRVYIEGTSNTKLDWNVFFLGSGTFVSVLATGYVAMALQLIATDVFGFTPDTTGFLLSLTLVVRAAFLSLCFPRIISSGRRWMTRRSGSEPSSTESSPNPSESGTPIRPVIPLPAEGESLATSTQMPRGSKLRRPSQLARLEHPNVASEAEVPNAAGEPITDLSATQEPSGRRSGSAFDLFFLRESVFLDGILTGAVTFSTQGWHMYLAAAVLPFASGTGPAARGVVMDIVPTEMRPDVLSGIALLEKLAQVATISIFGTAFAFLTEIDKPMLIFAADAAIAFVAWFMLIPVRIPKTIPQTAT